MRTMPSQGAHTRFGDLLGSVYYGKEAVVVEKKGKPVAVVTGPAVDERLPEQDEQRRERMWQAIDRIQERNADKDPDAELDHITEVVEEVRRERYERAQRHAAEDRR